MPEQEYSLDLQPINTPAGKTPIRPNLTQKPNVTNYQEYSLDLKPVAPKGRMPEAGEGAPTPSGSVTEQPTAQGYFRKYIAPYTRTAGTVAGEVLGSPGGPQGAIGGGLIGNLLMQRLQALQPDIFGAPPDQSPVGQLTTAGSEELANQLGGKAIEGIGGIGGKFIDKLKGMFPVNRSPQVVEAMRATPETPLSVGQATGNKSAEWAENVFTPKEKSALISKQKGLQQERIAGPLAEDLAPLEGKIGKTVSKLQQDTMSNLEHARTDFEGRLSNVPSQAFRDVVDQNGNLINRVKIEAPITLQNTSQTAYQISKELESISPNARMVEGPFKGIDDLVHTILEEPPTVNRSGVKQSPQMEFQRINAMHEQIIDKLNSLKTTPSGVESGTTDLSGVKGKLAQQLTALDRSLTSDMDASIQKWGADHYARYVALQNTKIAQSNFANSELTQKLLKAGVSPDVTYNQVALDALKDLPSTQRFLTATGTSGRKYLAGTAMKDMLQNGINETGEFDAKRALQQLVAKQDVYAAAIPSQALSNWKNWLTTQAAIPAQSFPFMSHVMQWKKATLGFTIPATSLAMAITGHSSPLSHLAASGAEVLGLYGIEGVVNKLMLNPTTARAMIEAAKMPASAPAASTTSRILLRALAGTGGLTVATINGESRPAEIDQNGKVVVH
jgi:hypothetical protein